MSGWKTQKIDRFDSTRRLVGTGKIELSDGTVIEGRFYRIAYGTGTRGPEDKDQKLFEKHFLIFLKDGDTDKYYVPNPPFDGQDNS